LWRLPGNHPAAQLLAAEARKDSARAWGAWLSGARLMEVQGDPAERWLGLVFQRRAITGKLETVRVAFQAIPGRAGIRLDGLETAVPRLGLGVPFAAAPPLPEGEPPPLRRWKERFGDRLDAALAGELDEALPGEGDLLDRHRAQSEAEAEAAILAPRRAAAERSLAQEEARLARLAAALDRDRAKHEAGLALKPRATALAGELWRLKGATGEAVLMDGTRIPLPEGRTAEQAVQTWFDEAKKGERGLARLAELATGLARQRVELAARREALEAGGGLEAPAPKASSSRGPKAGAKAHAKETRKVEKRKDGKGAAFRSVQIEGFEILIGKGDAENDQLTFKVAENPDFWLHVANLPGSHVVIRNPDRISEPPRAVLERAAELAAYHSKAKDAGKTEVHWCRIADISKPRGFAPGKVILKQWKSVRVYPKP
ncbi:MAG TPA: NFACT RNA binding domain-containing protein, partial [Holophagaceae bacterium]|nr:NFACT RNA binding domain-containing protein [Holophagaceae bacterium]